MALAEKRSKSNGSSVKKRARMQYVVCIKNEDYAASLELRKLYAVIPDRSAAKAGMRRVIDESGEDYLYPEEYFVDIKLPSSIERVVRMAS
jgi:hypothetical protein